MRIICGTNFTESARRAGAVAAMLTTRFEDMLLLVHSLEGGGAGSISGGIYDSLCAITKEQLQTEAERLRCLGATVKTELLTGSPSNAILQKAVPASTRLIVVSPRSEDPPRMPRLGSVAERIAESSPVPTLVVRCAEPFAAWTRAEHPLRILCAYDFTTTSDAVLTYLKELRRFGPCDFVVAHVDATPDEQARLGFPGPAPFDGNAPEVQLILERNLREKVNATLGDDGADIRVRGAWGRPDYELIEIANQEHAQLIVTGTHQRHGLERLFHTSVSRALLRYAPMNVLVVPVARELMKTLPRNLHGVLMATDFAKAGSQAAGKGVRKSGEADKATVTASVHPGAAAWAC
jgi:nucleotide-binding universal stress UspA family protein